MRIIISPAKKMKLDTDSLPWEELPQFLDQAEALYQKLQSMDYEALKRLWKCNDQIAQQNVQRLKTLDLRRNLTPALLAYEGIQYRYMAPGVFTREELNYVQTHVRILSGLYGLLRPFDGVIPYRLEMQAKLKVAQAKDLYDYWGGALARQLYDESGCVINLASKEYSLCISRHQKPGTELITCVFGEEEDGRVVEKGTLCKMARGEMVRYLAQVQGEAPEALKGFSRLGYEFAPERSDDSNYVFLRRKEAK